MNLLNLAFWRRARSLPMIRQTEAAECGLACVAMIAAYWGNKSDLLLLRRRFSISIKGATLRNILLIAEEMGLKARPLKVDLNRLVDLPVPAILHWGMNHFVVLNEIDQTRALVHDPAVGVRRLATQDLASYYTGVAVECSPREDFQVKQEKLKFSLQTLTGPITGLKRGLFELLFLGGALQVCVLLAPFYLQWVVDEALLSADKDLLVTLGVGFLLVVVLQSLISAARSWVTTTLATSFSFQWLGNAFSHLLKLPISYFEKRHLGDIVSRFNSIQTIQRSLTSQFVETIVDGVLVITTLILMLFYNALMSSVAILTVTLYGIAKVVLFHRTREATAEQIVHAAKQQTFFLESARGVQTIRLFGNEAERRTRWLNSLGRQMNAELSVARFSTFGQWLSGFLFGSQRVIIIWLAAEMVLAGQLTVGMMIAFLVYQDQFSLRAGSLIDKLLDFRLLRVHAERIADMALTPIEIDGGSATLTELSSPPKLDLKGISFRYSDGEPYVLKNLDLTIDAGESIAITGSSGSGKTTLIKILLGLLAPTEGEISVNGRLLKNEDLPRYRQIIGTVMQDDRLFAGSLAENICFFDLVPDELRIRDCARLAGVDADILRMPMGYNTLVGDLGVGLSGGQTQRILLARALYKEPRVLILDEATSHLDIHGENVVVEAIRSLPLTRIVVAHRPNTISGAQRHVALRGGRLVPCDATIE